MIKDDTWTPQPLPLYSVEGTLVPPTLYTATLPGAFVSVKFTLTRQRTPSMDTANYRANVEEVHLLDMTRLEMGRDSYAKLVDSVRRYPEENL